MVGWGGSSGVRCVRTERGFVYECAEAGRPAALYRGRPASQRRSFQSWWRAVTLMRIYVEPIVLGPSGARSGRPTRYSESPWRDPLVGSVILAFFACHDREISKCRVLIGPATGRRDFWHVRSARPHHTADLQQQRTVLRHRFRRHLRRHRCRPRYRRRRLSASSPLARLTGVWYNTTCVT